LEQNEKSYADLQSKFRSLQNEYQLMNEAKLRLEYELKQKTESNNKTLNELQAQNDSLVKELNEKNAMNKKLYNDNNNLFRTLEAKKNENEVLINQTNENENLIAHLNQDKEQCEKEIHNLNLTSQQNQTNISDLNQQMDQLNIQNQTQEKNLQQKSNELSNNQRMLNEEKFQNQNLVQKLGEIDNSLEQCQRQLELANKTIAQIENDYNSMNNENDRTKNDYENLRADFEKERAIRTEGEHNNNKLEGILRERNDTINKLSLMNNSLKTNMDQAGNAKARLLSDIERYKNYIIILTEQTQKLSDELERIVEEDERMYLTVNQIERLGNFVTENKQILNEAIEALNTYRPNQPRLNVSNNNMSGYGNNMSYGSIGRKRDLSGMMNSSY
jgi:exonuclease SbcC